MIEIPLPLKKEKEKKLSRKKPQRKGIKQK